MYVAYKQFLHRWQIKESAYAFYQLKTKSMALQMWIAVVSVLKF